MRAATPTPLRLVAHHGHRRDRAGRAEAWLFPAIVGIAILAMLFAVATTMSAERRGLRALPQEQREALLARSVDELRDFCGGDRADALKDHCRELATFAAQFAECRGDCNALVRHQLNANPTR